VLKSGFTKKSRVAHLGAMSSKGARGEAMRSSFETYCTGVEVVIAFLISIKMAF